MIFEIADGITALSVEKYPDFACALSAAVDNRHFLNIHYKAATWIEKTILKSNDFYGDIQRELLSSVIAKTPSSMLSKYLATFTVGDKPDADVARMLTLAKEHSNIILENSKYDGAAIDKWIKLYRDERGFKNLNELIATLIADNRIRFANAGGKDNIPNEADSLMGVYKKMHSYKMLAIFDSDKHHAKDTDKNVHIKRELDNRQISWYELSNRAIENYFPFSTYRKANLVKAGVTSPSIGETNDWDYYDLYSLEDLNFVKSNLVDLARQLTKSELQFRLAHKTATPDEIQTIILEIAKIA